MWKRCTDRLFFPLLVRTRTSLAAVVGQCVFMVWVERPWREAEVQGAGFIGWILFFFFFSWVSLYEVQVTSGHLINTICKWGWAPSINFINTESTSPHLAIVLHSVGSEQGLPEKCNSLIQGGSPNSQVGWSKDGKGCNGLKVHLLTSLVMMTVFLSQAVVVPSVEPKPPKNVA